MKAGIIPAEILALEDHAVTAVEPAPGRHMKKILFAAALVWSAAAYAADFETLAVRASDLKASAWTQPAAAEPAVAVYQPAENSQKSAKRTEFQFKIKPLPTGPSSRAEIEQGLLDLYKNAHLSGEISATLPKLALNYRIEAYLPTETVTFSF